MECRKHKNSVEERTDREERRETKTACGGERAAWRDGGNVHREGTQCQGHAGPARWSQRRGPSGDGAREPVREPDTSSRIK